MLAPAALLLTVSLIEAALSVFLLCGAGLIAQNLWTLISTPMGFDPKQVLAMRLQLPEGQQNMPAAKAKLVFPEYVRKVAAIPGVDSAATVTGPPLRPARGGLMLGGFEADPVPVDPRARPASFRTADLELDLDVLIKMAGQLTVEVPLLPFPTETEVGEAEMEKLGEAAVPVSALIKPLPFGLPQPVAKP